MQTITKKRLCYSICIILMIIIYNSKGASLGTTTASSSPSTVSSSATLQILTSPVTTIPSGGKILITVPSTTSITQGSLSCSMVEPSGIVVTCSGSGSTITAVLGSAVNALLIQINISGFTNPPTTTTTSSFIIQTTDSSGNTLDSKSSGITLTATVGSLTAASMTPASDVVGAINTVTFSITLNHAITSGGTIQISFPKWNPNAPSGSIYSMIQGTYACTGVQNIDSGMSCAFTNDILTLSQINPTTSISSGSVVKFTVTSIRNPMSTATKSGITITTFASNGGSIDTASLTLTVGTPATIASGSTSATTSTVVSEATTFKVTFSLPLPMDSGWGFDITFPSDIVISSFTAVNGYGAFGAMVALLSKSTIDTTNNKITVTNAATTYTTNDFDAIIEFVQITNPLSIKPTSSFTILLKTSAGNSIATINSGITYTATGGAITSMSATADNTVVGTSTSVLFNFKPTHKIPVSSRIIVIIPVEASIAAKDSTSCTLSSLSQIQSSATCTVSGLTITISSPFSADFIQDGTKTIGFKIGGVTMPGTTATPSSATFQTCYLVSSTCYNIDTGSSSILKATIGTLTSVNVVPTSLVANALTKYTFNIVPAHTLPIGSIILITIPSDISIPNPTYTGNSCSYSRRNLNSLMSSNYEKLIDLNFNRVLASTGLQNTFSCSATTTTIQVNNGFQTSAFSSGGTISFDIDGIQNPISLKPTSTFTVVTQLSSSVFIDQLLSGITVTMTSVSQLQSVSLSSTSLVNGASNSLSMSISSPTNLSAGFKLVVVFPSQITLPSSIACVGTLFLSTSLTCTKSSQTVTVTLSFSSGSTLSSGATFTLRFDSITNPTSTQPTDNFSVTITDSSGYLVNSYSSDVKLTTTTGGTITSASLSQSSKDASGSDDVTFTVTFPHAIPANGMIAITYPLQVSVDSTTLAASLTSPSIIASLTLSLNSAQRKIQITDMFPSGVSAGATYIFVIKNIKNSNLAAATDSFSISTFTNSAGSYIIDSISSGLTMTANCNYPCSTCSSSDLSSCNSCLTATPAIYLQGTSCVTTCNEGYLPISGVCVTCNSICVACDQTNKDTCTKCGKTGYEYLSGTSCVGTCPDGTYGNIITNTCDSCDSTSAKCASCSSNAVTCKTCVTSPTKYYLYGTSCVSSCPSGTSVYNSSTDKCDGCNSNCLTCSSSTTTCTSCATNKMLDLRSNTCVDSCETGKTIVSGTNCIGCDSSCLTCASSTSKCTSCSGSLVVTTTNTCASSCTNSNEIAISNVCTTCNPKCSSCSGTISNCTSCYSPLVLYNNDCIESCPLKYQSQNQICVYVGLICPTNYQLNSDKTSCVPTILTCNSGYQLNSSGDQCIPNPTGIVPFPFIFLLICFTLIVIAGRIKFALSKWIANFIALYGIVEPCVMLTMIVSCAPILQYISAILAAIALALYYCINTVMFIYFRKVTLKDAEFSRWIRSFRKTKIALSILSIIFSYRIFKLFYSSIFGLDNCMAIFENSEKALIKIQKWLSFVTLVIVYPLLTVSSIFVFINVSWGYQSLVTAIEIIIIYFIFALLFILERIFDPHPCRETEYVKIGIKKLGEDITMAGVPIDYSDSIREKEEDQNVELRKQALAGIIASIQSNKFNTLFSGETLNSCRLESNMRRAFSFRHLPSIPEDSEEDTDSEGEVDYGYKPRRKRRFSMGTDNDLGQYADKRFFSAIDDIRSGKYLPNNVYADSYPPREFTEKDRFLNVDRATQTDDNDLKLLWKLARTIPAFKLSDILGEFEVDPNGMYIIIRDGGKLKDKHGRLVNSRGYLIDQAGNVIHQNGTLIFTKDELDENNEIPAPFLLDENEYGVMPKPELIPKSKPPPINQSKPPKPSNFDNLRKGLKKSTKSKPMSRTSKRSRDTKGSAERLTENANKEKPPIEVIKINKNRGITAEAKRPATTKRKDKKHTTMVENLTEGKTAEVKEEGSELDSVFGIERIPITRHQNLFKENLSVDPSENEDKKERSSDWFMFDYMLNSRPEYYGDTSDIISRSRKLYY